MAARRHDITTILLVAVSLVIATFIDTLVRPSDHFISAPFAIPILIAAYRFPKRAAVLVSVLVILVGGASAVHNDSPPLSLSFHILALVIIGSIAIMLGEERRRSAQRAREASEARREINDILRSITDAFCALDDDWRFTYLNPEAERFFRQVFPSDAGQLLGRDFWTVFPNVRDNVFARELQRAMSDRVTVSFEAEYLPLQNWLEVHIYPAPDGLSVYFRNITVRRRIEDALRRQSQIIDQIHDAVVSTDLEGRITSWNKGAERIFVYSAAEALGQHISFVYPEGVYPEGPRAFLDQQVIAPLLAKRAHEIEVTMQRKDGELFTADLRLSLLRNREGVVTGLIGYTADITARTRAEAERAAILIRERAARAEAEAERARLETIFQSAGNAIIYVDAATGLLTVNPEAVRLFGRSFSPAAGQAQYVSSIYHSDGTPLTESEMPARLALQGQSISHEELLVAQPSGRRIPVMETAAPVQWPDGTVIGAVIVFDDISVFKELERMREEWTSVIAHDLRQPVTAIMGYAGLLVQKIPSSGRTEETKAVNHILTASRNLNVMISDLLDVSRIEARRLRLQRRIVRLDRVIQAAVERAAVITGGHTLRVVVNGELPPVEVDPARIEQVLSNLLSNAAKYGFPDSDIVVTLERSNGEAEVSVTNQGPGISSEEMPRLFSRFYRTKGAQGGGVTGLGLGLYISKGLIEAHGGRIWVESVPDQTTTFSFTVSLSSG